MLPLTKRRGDHSEANPTDSCDVPLESSGSAASSSPERPQRPRLPSVCDEEPTNIFPSKSRAEALQSLRGPSPRPAAGLPFPSPPPSSVRTGQNALPRSAHAGARPKIVKRATLSPSALMEGPRGSAHSHDAGLRSTPPSGHTKVLPSGAHPTNAGGVESSGSFAMPPYPGPYPMSAPYQMSAPPPSVSVSAVSMPSSIPAHFMVPSLPAADAHPGDRGASRSTASWAMVVLGIGLFVGAASVGAVRTGSMNLLHAGAAFVDPTHVPGASASEMAAVVASKAPSVAPTAVAVSVPVVTAVAAPAVAAPAVAAPAVAAPAVAVPLPASVAPAHPTLPASPPRGSRPSARPTAPEPVAAAPVTKSTPAPARVKPAPAPPAKPAADVDDEQRKALKALHESQLESTF